MRSFTARQIFEFLSRSARTAVQDNRDGGGSGLWVPETMHTASDLLVRRQPATDMIRRWRYS
jgi:hypothetical protein